MKAATFSLLIFLSIGNGFALAGPILQGGFERATNFAYPPNFTNGYDFTSIDDQSLTALGFWDQGANGLPRSFQVGVWFTATGTLLASAIIDNADPIDLSVSVNGGNWRYESLVAPLALTAGSTYTLAFQAGPDELIELDSLFINYPSLVVNRSVTIPNQARFGRDSTLTFPLDTVTADETFRAMVNAQFTVVPEPSTFYSAALAVVLLCGWRAVRALPMLACRAHEL